MMNPADQMHALRSGCGVLAPPRAFVAVAGPDAEAARSESRALTAAITKLEQDTALLRLNLNESAVLESFLLASLRIWSRR